MKKWFWLILAAVCCLTVTALAQDTQREALTAEELFAWTDGLLVRARASQPLNDPTEPAAQSEDGYAFVYDFATLYMDKPVLDEHTRVKAVVLTSAEEKDLRGISIDYLLSEVLDAYYNENPQLKGDQGFAGLYLADTLPTEALWGWVQRDGQRVQAVQYAVHDQLPSGGDGYTDCGVIYTMQQGLVAAIRAYGLDAVITPQAVESNLQAVQEVLDEDGYRMYPTSLRGTDLAPFEEADLTFSGVSFAAFTPEQAIALWGQPGEDTWMEDGGNYLRTLEYSSLVLTFAYDSQRQHPTLDTVTIDEDGPEGPRGVRVGDILSSVISRFRSGEGAYQDGKELYYGDGTNAPYGMAEYGDDASATLRYALKLTDGRVVVLYMTFARNALTELTLYCE